MDFDLVVVGAGPGGYVAAIRAAQLGLRTAIVERDKLGGVCLNWGCIPTKALLKSAETFETLGHLEDYGLRAEKVSFDLGAVVARSRKVAGQLNAGVAFLMKKNKVTVIEGEARLEPGTPAPVVRVALKAGGEQVLKAANVILATGARARILPELGLAPDGERVWSYREAMVPDRVPTSLLVVGSGAIGIEFASFYNDMGAEVTVVEMLDRIVPVEDADVSTFLEKALTKQGMTIMTGAGVEELKATATGVSAKIKGKDGKVVTSEFTHCIVAIGIVPNTENIGLEALGVEMDRGFLKTDTNCRTNVPGLWAIGDITAPPWLAHKASHEGVIAAETIAGGHPHAMDPLNIPGCTYCHPQVASVGLTEAKAKEAGYDVKVGNFPFMGNGKAIALGEAEGFIKTVFDAKTGELLGAHMVGAEVTELIQGYTIGKTAELVEADFMHTVFPHPTLSEMMHESVLGAYGKMLHM